MVTNVIIDNTIWKVLCSKLVVSEGMVDQRLQNDYSKKD